MFQQNPRVFEDLKNYLHEVIFEQLGFSTRKKQIKLIGGKQGRKTSERSIE